MMAEVSGSGFSGAYAGAFHTDRNSSVMSCNYCHRWGHVKATCYRKSKVCFRCHRVGHYVASYVSRFRQQARVTTQCLVRRHRSWGGVPQAREHWQDYIVGSVVANISRWGRSRQGRGVASAPYFRASPSRGMISGAVASCKFQWVGPTTARKYRGTIEQGNFIHWLGEHLFGSHEDHPGFNDTLARPEPPVAAERSRHCLLRMK